LNRNIGRHTGTEREYASWIEMIEILRDEKDSTTNAGNKLRLNGEIFE
jgi:hypothetical protein